MRKRAINIARFDPSWSGRYEIRPAECVLTPFDGCACISGGTTGCHSPFSYYCYREWDLREELDRLTKQRDEKLYLALKDEMTPIYPSNTHKPAYHVDLSSILDQEFTIMFRTELAKREKQTETRGDKDNMKIFVKLLGGKTIDVLVEPSDTGFTLKKKIQDKEGILPSKLLLVFAGKEVVDERLVSEFSIFTGNIIYQAMIPNGCLSGCDCTSGGGTHP
jgi:ubiquitin